jgi:diguanylate cyclase (GGDEF)-like protein
MKFASKYCRQFIIISIVILFTVGFTTNKTSQAAEVHRVLFISSYHGAFTTYPDQIEGLTNVFYEEGILFDIEFMDTNRFHTEENYSNYYQFLKYRLDNTEPYDVIIVSDDNGLQFLMDHKDNLVGDIPVIYLGINDMNRVLEAGSIPTFTGIYESTSIRENLDLAMKLQPDADTFYVIADKTTTGQGDVRAFLELGNAYPTMNFEVLNFSEFSLDEFKEKIGQLSTDDILIYMTMFQDKENNVYSIEESVDILTESANTPIYRPTIGGVGNGLLGGYMLSYTAQAQMAAQMALDVLNGVSIESIPIVTESPNKYIIDYEVMKKFGLNLEMLPKDAKLINKPIVFFEKYEDLVMPLSIVSGLILLIFAFLIFENRKNYRHAKEMREKNDELSALYEELAASEEELRYQYDELSENRKQLLKSEKEFKHLAYHDDLTGLHNRSALFKKLSDILSKRQYQGRLYSVDLDNFKYINDTCGHKLGDDILVTIGERFKAFEDIGLIVSRVGGDEFVIIQYWHIENQPKINDIHKKINAIVQKQILIDEEAFHISCSIGIVTFPDQGTQEEELIRKADIAMYQAKAKGRARLTFYNDFMETESVNILGIQNSIHKAIEENQFKLFLQPQIDMQTEKIVAFEGLIRWDHPKKGIISPIEFIPIAEQLGVIHNIGRWVYNAACRDVKKMITKHFVDMKIAVNVSVVELTRIDFESDFMELLDEYDLDADCIAIELTEGVFMEATEMHLDKLKKLRESGIKLHLDDFGTGYSSLKYLMDLPIDVVKIDREFMKNISSDTRVKNLLQSIIQIVHNLDMTVIAEGIETKEQHDILKALGCDMAQGYYYAKPMCFEEALALIEG